MRFLAGDCPDSAREEDLERIERLSRRPLVGLYDSWVAMERARATVQAAAPDLVVETRA